MESEWLATEIVYGRFVERLANRGKVIAAAKAIIEKLADENNYFRRTDDPNDYPPYLLTIDLQPAAVAWLSAIESHERDSQ